MSANGVRPFRVRLKRFSSRPHSHYLHLVAEVIADDEIDKMEVAAVGGEEGESVEKKRKEKEKMKKTKKGSGPQEEGENVLMKFRNAFAAQYINQEEDKAKEKAKEKAKGRGQYGHQGGGKREKEKEKEKEKEDGEREREWVPHLTVGQFSNDAMEDSKASLQSSWQSVEFEVTEFCMIWREGGRPFRVAERVFLPTDSRD